MKKYIYRTNWLKTSIRNNKKFWLDKNENSDEILNKINYEALIKINPKKIFAYPDLGPLYKLLAKKLKLNHNQLLLTAGADAGIKGVFESFVSKGDKVLRFEPTYAMYSIYSKAFKAKDLTIQYEKSPNGPYLDLEKIFQTILKEKPKLICLANPNSPTGTIIAKENMINILKLAKKKNVLF